MKGIKALTEDCLKNLDIKPESVIRLTRSQLMELNDSRVKKPFVKLEDGSWEFVGPNGKHTKVVMHG
jgi:hypothetical protein